MAEEYLQDSNTWFLYCPHCASILDRSECKVLEFNQCGETDGNNSSIEWITKTFKVRCANDPPAWLKQLTVDSSSELEEKSGT